MSAQDLKYSSSTIQADLDRFQRQKVADLREMSISMARSHRDWCKKVSVCSWPLPLRSYLALQNLEAWEEAKKEIDKIPDHPNQMPPTEATSPGVPGPSTMGRRDSSATVNGR